MYEHLTIRRFRLFQDVHVAPLGRINLLTGANNSGKTTLLEAIFLLSGGAQPEHPLRLNTIRGLASAQAPLEGAAKSIFGSLFHNLDPTREVLIEARHARHGDMSVALRVADSPAALLPLEHTDNGPRIMARRSSLWLTFKQSGATPVEAELRLTSSKGIEFPNPPSAVPMQCSILTSKTGTHQEDALRLSRLRQQKQGKVVREALAAIEPRLKSLEVNAATGETMIWGDIGLPELVPLGLMGEGMSRLARIVLAIGSTPRGVVLIDEIENGMHHTVLPKVWKAVDRAARASDTQIFATTHSFECVQAAQEAVEEGLAVHRLQPTAAPPTVGYGAKEIEAAVRHRIDVR